MATAVYGSLIILILLIFAIATLFLVIFIKNKEASLIPMWWYFLLTLLACFFLSYISSQESVVLPAKDAHHSYLINNLISAYLKMFISCLVIFNIPSIIFYLIYLLKFKFNNLFNKFNDYLKSL